MKIPCVLCQDISLQFSMKSIRNNSFINVLKFAHASTEKTIPDTLFVSFTSFVNQKTQNKFPSLRKYSLVWFHRMPLFESMHVCRYQYG